MTWYYLSSKKASENDRPGRSRKKLLGSFPRPSNKAESQGLLQGIVIVVVVAVVVVVVIVVIIVVVVVVCIISHLSSSAMLIISYHHSSSLIITHAHGTLNRPCGQTRNMYQYHFRWCMHAIMHE